MFTGHAFIDVTLRMSSPRCDHGGDVTMSGIAGSVCCVAWKDDHQFATASADHVIQLHSGDQACTATLRGDATDLTHLTWSPNGEHQLECSTCPPCYAWSAGFSCIASVTPAIWVFAAVLCTQSCSSVVALSSVVEKHFWYHHTEVT